MIREKNCYFSYNSKTKLAVRSGTISYGGSWLCDVFSCSSAQVRQHARYFQHIQRLRGESEIGSVLKERLKETMIQETSQIRLFKVNLTDNRDLENMYQTSSGAINWNYHHNMLVTVIQIKDVQSSIPWHPEADICSGKKMC